MRDAVLEFGICSDPIFAQNILNKFH